MFENNLKNRIFRAFCAVFVYVSLWACLSSMAFLGTASVLPLTLGAAVAILLPFLGKWRYPAGIAFLIIGIILIYVNLDGVKLLLNRLMTASAARQSYEYELYAVDATDPRAALFSLGVASGALVGCGLGPAAACAVLLAEAYLGISPEWYFSALLALTAALCFVRPGASGFAVAAISAVLSLFLVLVLFPGEDAALSGWDENARDRLAAATVAYSERLPEEKPEKEETPAPAELFTEEPSDAGLGGDIELPVPPSVLIIIAVFAILLFVPSVLSDRARRRREKRRSRLDDDAGAAFLYAMLWLRLIGVDAGNRPYSEIAEELPEELREEYRSVIPIWREAAYSDGQLSPEKKAAMRSFADRAEKTAWQSLGRRQKFMARYVYAY